MGNVSINVDFEEEDIDLDALKNEMSKQGLAMDQFFDIENEEICFKDETMEKFFNLTVSADCIYTPECRYQRNGDPGWPEEQELNDLEIEDIDFNGKKIDPLKVLTDRTISRLEEKIWDEFLYSKPERDYEED